MNWEEFLDECIPTPDTIVVEAYAGSGSYGQQFDTAVGVPLCVVQDGGRATKVQTSGASGEVRTSTGVVFTPLDADIPVGSRITLPSGRVTFALAVETLTDNGLGLPEHLEVSLE